MANNPRRTYTDSGRDNYAEDTSPYTNPAASYTTGQTGYSSSVQAGYGTGQAGYPTGQTGYGGQTTYNAGQPGYNTNQTAYSAAGYNTGQTGYTAGATAYGAGQTGYSTGQTGYSTGQTGYSTGQTGYGSNSSTYSGTGTEYSASAGAGPNWRWWLPAEGISREVIQADIQRYLGPDAVVRPGRGLGENASSDGYWIAAYRNLTTSMIDDLKADSRNWTSVSRRQGGNYEDSLVHQSRQYHGPTRVAAETPTRPYAGETTSSYTTDARPTRREEYSSRTSYSTSSRPQPTAENAGQNYAHGSNPYGGSPYDYTPEHRSQQPRTESTGNAAGYTQVPASQRAARPGYYIASDGREYPLSSMPSSHQR